MRITNRMITSKYVRSLNQISSDLNRLNNKVTSGRSFTKASENTSAAIRAYQLRRDMSKSEGFMANIQHAETTLRNSESSIMHIQELVQNAQTKIIQGVNGTQSESERKIIATELRNIQDQMLQTLNGSSSDMYYFGGTNTTEKPFTLDASGKLMYNGNLLDDPALDSASLLADSRFVDIGLNVRVDASGTIDNTSVFKYSIPGLQITGYGQEIINGEPVSTNLYDLIGRMAAELEKDSGYDKDMADALLGKLQQTSPKVVHALTDVGAKTSYLEFITDRLETKEFNDQERQMKLEAADPAETIIYFKSQEAAYNAALQMGTKIIQPSIFDYMN
jgi:flagellar hook-associated protein 3 FlgL